MPKALIFEPIIDAIQQVAAGWEPVNGNGQAAANEMRQMVREAPEVFEALAQMWSTMAAKCVDQILMDSGAADVLQGAATYCRAPVDHLQEAAEAMDRPHGADIDRIHSGHPATAAWDWDRNQDYQV